ncbi:hypothetical protein C4K03_1066 [Pseudomonas synxantha]|uniref:SMI1/KNR4 family protein n=1 Tax=Pseudomonas synxantha TaxID=47883 RepID=A0A3G7U1N5_9PSED|nr:hypothetical protein [Pseudomonas synxantha]AZE53237.1 hypothetical protein C4K03_1066 [Pseudomonas synxantha]
MLSKKLIDFCKKNGWWFDDSSSDYELELQKIGISLSSDFGEFYLHVEDGPTFIHNGKEIYQICWFSKNTDFESNIKSAQAALGLKPEHIPLDSFEGEFGYFYNIKNGTVTEISLGQSLEKFTAGNLQPQWKNFNDFMESYFELE